MKKSKKRLLILGVNGSPRKGGRVAGMLKKVLKEIEKKGVNTQLINLSDYKILPHSGKLDPTIYIERTLDDMPDLQRLVLKANGLILGSPTYWFNLSSQMKLFMDRLTSLEHYNFLLEGKAGAIITYGPQGGAATSAMLMAMFINQMGMIVPPYCLIFDEGRKDKWLKGAFKLMAKNILLQVQVSKNLRLNWDSPHSKYKISPIELLKKKKK